VLKAASGSEGAMRFSPALKTKQKLWKAMPVGHALRVVMRFRPDVWRRGLFPKEMRARNGRALGFLHSRERYFPVWWSEAPAPVLVGWTGGPAAEELAHVSPRKKFSRACQTLSKLLSCSPSVLRKQVVDFRIHDWTVDPFTRGAYSFSIAGLEDAPARMAKPEARTLFFAGEATADPLELGTVHGALARGERAAKQILEGR
jgi:monoamine oxidase